MNAPNAALEAEYAGMETAGTIASVEVVLSQLISASSQQSQFGIKDKANAYKISPV